MVTKGTSESHLPTTGIITALLVVVSAFLVHKSTLVSTRPSTPEAVPAFSADVQNIAARLWDDPFVAAQGTGSDKEETAARRTPKHACESPYPVAARQNLDGREVILAPTMVFGGPYPEDAEHRRRTRTAVLAGLNVAGFVPYDAGHIGCFSVRFALAAEPLLVPFEWVDEERGPTERPRSIEVLWLDESRFRKEPLARLDYVLRQVIAAHMPPKGSTRDVRAISHRRGPKVRIIGPAGSDVLRELQPGDLPSGLRSPQRSPGGPDDPDRLGPDETPASGVRAPPRLAAAYETGNPSKPHCADLRVGYGPRAEPA